MLKVFALAALLLTTLLLPAAHAEEEKTLADTVASAHQQIKEKQYEALLLEKGFTEENIRTYGFAFEGKKVLIG